MEKTRTRKTLKEQFTDHLEWFRKKMETLNKERVYQAAMDEDCSADTVKDSYITAREALHVVAKYILNTPLDPPKEPSDE